MLSYTPHPSTSLAKSPATCATCNKVSSPTNYWPACRRCNTRYCSRHCQAQNFDSHNQTCEFDPNLAVTCTNCGKASTAEENFPACGRCHARYCTRDCQRKHWGVHRIECEVVGWDPTGRDSDSEEVGLESAYFGPPKIRVYATPPELKKKTPTPKKIITPTKKRNADQGGSSSGDGDAKLDMHANTTLSSLPSIDSVLESSPTNQRSANTKSKPAFVPWSSIADDVKTRSRAKAKRGDDMV